MDPSILPPPSTDPPLPPPAPASSQPPHSGLPPPPPPPAPNTNASIANPTHPPYADMIYAAITALKERDGSSKRAIAKYIEKAYTNLPPTHSALLTYHLKRLKNSGLLVMVKKSYKLPRSDATPPLQLPPTNDNNLNLVNNSNTAAIPPAHAPAQPRGRGRPPKSGAGSGLVLEKPKRSPGRPRKTAGPVQRGPTKMRPGRPRKPKSVKGRQSQVQDQLNPVTVSYVTTDANVHAPVPVPVPVPGPVPGGPRPRGRPRKIGTGGDAGGKRRGRPPKTLKSSPATGRPVGRPRRNLSSALTEAAEAQAQAIADLKRKLEFLQSKVKQAVSVLKPQITSESQIGVVAAIQELEGLAAMDIINAPPRDDPQPPPQLQS